MLSHGLILGNLPTTQFRSLTHTPTMSTNNTSQSQYKHIYDTSDTHHAHPYTKTNTTDGEHHKPVHAQHPHHLPLVIPDLRFERSYLNSIASHVHVKPLQGSSLRNSHEDDLDFASASATDGVEYSVVVDWRKVAWITMRDQMISPLVQGAVWFVNIS